VWLCEITGTFNTQKYLHYMRGNQSVNKVSVRMLTPDCAQVSEELLERYRRDPAKVYFTTRYSR